jgi:tricorn protease
LALVTLALLAPTAVAQEAGESNVTLPRHPSISPDGQSVVFSYRGDLWKVGIDGGAARRLTAHPANDLGSRFSPDGATIAFTSDRRGPNALFTMNADGTGVREVLVVDRAAFVTDFADDGHLYFTGFLEPDVYRASRPYRVDAEGGVHERVHDAFGRTPSKEPGGDRVLFVRGDSGWDRRHSRGPDTRDVWLFDPEAEDRFIPLITRRGNDGKPRWAGNDGTFVFASDRVDRTVNLFLADADDGELAEQNARRLTAFTDRDVEDFDVTPDGRTLVFARWDSLYTLDLTDPDAEPVELTLRAAEDEGDRVKYVDTDTRVSDAALSPDGKTLAMIAYGQVYLRAADERAPTRRVTDAMAHYKDVAWSPDGGTLYFTGDPDGRDQIYAATVRLTRSDIEKTLDEPTTKPADRQDAAPDPDRWEDALAFAIEPVTDDPEGMAFPAPSPDGTKLVVTRGVGDVVVLDLETGDQTVLLEGWSRGPGYVWTPDSNHVLYSTEDADFNSDVWAIRADGTGIGESDRPVNLTRHPDDDGLMTLSADGRMLAFVSERVNDEYDVWMVYLDETLEALTPQELAEYHKELAADVKKLKPIDVPAFVKERGTVSPLNIEDVEPEPEVEAESAPATQPATRPATRPSTENLRKLWASLTGRPDESDDDEPAAKKPAKSPVDMADFDELPLDTAYLRLRRVSRERGSEWNATLLPDASAIYYTSGGTLFKKPWDGSASSAGSNASLRGTSLKGDRLVLVAGGRGGFQATSSSNRRQTFTADDRLEINIADESERKFRTLARVLGDQFYHPTMKGLDWPALVEAYAPLARGAATKSEFEHVADKLLGELNASHLGVTAPGQSRPSRRSLGLLGIRTQLVDDGFEVIDVLETGPAGVGDMRLREGDVITRLELEPVDRDRPIEVQLPDRVNRETVVTVNRDGGEVNLLLTPVSNGVIRARTYDAWRLANLRRVEELSDGRLGYIHVRGMDQGSLDVFERDLYAAAEGKEGLLVDVRNNGGGWTTDRLLASIMYPKHSYTVPRGMRDSVDADRVNLERGGYPQDRLFIQRYTLPMNMLANENSFSNAEIISHAFKQLGRGTLVGEETAGGVISTGAFSLLDGTRVRLPFRGWYLLDGSDMENNGAVPDILVPQTPEAEVAGDDPQLQAAIEDLLARLDEQQAEAAADVQGIP